MAPLLRFAPLELGRLAEPFDPPEWVFELKYDGFRALAQISDGKVELISRRGYTYKSWPALREDLGRELREHRAILDGETRLPRRPGPARLPRHALLASASGLRRLRSALSRRRGCALVATPRAEAPPRGCSYRRAPRSLLYAQHVERNGRALFAEACALDLEGIVARLATAPYRATNPPHRVKIKNPTYSQGEGRHEFFEARR